VIVLALDVIEAAVIAWLAAHGTRRS